MKKAFTLVELLVYMAIMGFIIVVAGRVFSDSTSMRVRTQNMTKASEDVNKIAELLKEDLSQMGVKEWKDNSSQNPDDDVFMVSDSVYMRKGNDDLSSYDLIHGAAENDSIAFRKIAFNDDGEYVGVHQISWALSADNVLRRRCLTLVSATTANDPICPKGSRNDLEKSEPIVMARDVQAFHLLPSSPGTSQAEQTASGLPFGGSTGTATFALIDRGASSACINDDAVCAIGNIEQPGASSRVAVVSSFKYNGTGGKQKNELYVSEPQYAGESYGSCKKFNFKKGETYYVQFETPIGKTYQDTIMSLFQPGIDHAAIGFRKSSGDTIYAFPRDFLFYAPQLADESNKKHYFDFSVSSDVNQACAVFTFAFYSPRAGSGILRIKDFEIGQKNDAYRFVRKKAGEGDEDEDYKANYAAGDLASEYENKRKVKAFELTLEINKGGEIVSTRPIADESGNFSNGYVIPTPNNGISAVGTKDGGAGD